MISTMPSSARTGCGCLQGMHEDGRHEHVEALPARGIEARQQAALTQTAQLLGDTGRVSETGVAEPLQLQLR
jgi:hypothetical protein